MSQIQGQNGEITYHLVGADGLFTVEQDGDFARIILAGNLDYEQNKTITFHVSTMLNTLLDCFPTSKLFFMDAQ